jgi:hypothetical protein
MAPKDIYKISFVTNWGVFTWVLMSFGMKNGPPTYHNITNLTCDELMRSSFIHRFVHLTHEYQVLKIHLTHE